MHSQGFFKREAIAMVLIALAPAVVGLLIGMFAPAVMRFLTHSTGP
jgi:hypothetical protein